MSIITKTVEPKTVEEMVAYLKELKIPAHLHTDIIGSISQGEELSNESYEKLFGVFMIEMPYGTAKARDGDPWLWIENRLRVDWGMPAYS